MTDEELMVQAVVSLLSWKKRKTYVTENSMVQSLCSTRAPHYKVLGSQSRDRWREAIRSAVAQGLIYQSPSLEYQVRQ